MICRQRQERERELEQREKGPSSHSAFLLLIGSVQNFFALLFFTDSFVCRMTDEISTPVDLSIKRKSDGIDEHRKSSTKKKSRSNHQLNNDNEIPLDLSVKADHSISPSRSTIYSTATMPFYDPTNLFFNSSALIYDLLLTNLNSYCHQQQQQRQMRPKSDGFSSTTSTKSSKGNIPFNSVRSTKDVSLNMNKQESYACSCGERYSNAAQLVSHLKITNHSAQSSSTHDEVAKLVRGQDIWLSRDTNPANQILKCLRCSLSFETLPDLTAHMMKTNHFTQLASNSSTYPHSNPRTPSTSPLKSSIVQPKSTCLVCSQQFSRELDLVDHLQRLHQIRFNCTTCGMYFENENLYKDHLLKEMHHRNGKNNRNRDYFLSQYKHFPKQCNTITESK